MARISDESRPHPFISFRHLYLFFSRRAGLLSIDPPRRSSLPFALGQTTTSTNIRTTGMGALAASSCQTRNHSHPGRLKLVPPRGAGFSARVCLPRSDRRHGEGRRIHLRAQNERSSVRSCVEHRSSGYGGQDSDSRIRSGRKAWIGPSSCKRKHTGSVRRACLRHTHNQCLRGTCSCSGSKR